MSNVPPVFAKTAVPFGSDFAVCTFPSLVAWADIEGGSANIASLPNGSVGITSEDVLLYVSLCTSLYTSLIRPNTSLNNVSNGPPVFAKTAVSFGSDSAVVTPSWIGTTLEAATDIGFPFVAVATPSSKRNKSFTNVFIPVQPADKPFDVQESLSPPFFFSSSPSAKRPAYHALVRRFPAFSYSFLYSFCSFSVLAIFAALSASALCNWASISSYLFFASAAYLFTVATSEE